MTDLGAPKGNESYCCGFFFREVVVCSGAAAGQKSSAKAVQE